MSVGVVIVAAGNGTRMGGSVRKAYLELCGTPILIGTLKQFVKVPEITETVVVVHLDELDRTEQLLQSNQIDHVKIVIGGAERQDSVVAGVHALSKGIDTVLIHDGARPFVSPDLIRMLIDEVKQRGAVIPATPVKDTIKVVQETGMISNTPNRKGLWAAQTPQAFSLSLLREAFTKAEERGIKGTDDASILEELGYPVYVIEGERMNIKITTPEDILFGEAIVRWMEEIR